MRNEKIVIGLFGDVSNDDFLMVEKLINTFVVAPGLETNIQKMLKMLHCQYTTSHVSRTLDKLFK